MPHHDDGDKVTTRDAHCGHHNEHLKKMSTKKLTYNEILVRLISVQFLMISFCALLLIIEQHQ